MELKEGFLEEQIKAYQMAQEGSVERDLALYEIITAFKEEKGHQLRKLRLSMPRRVTDADLHAVFDDALWKAIEFFDCNSGMKFGTVFTKVLNSTRVDFLRTINREKRQIEEVYSDELSNLVDEVTECTLTPEFESAFGMVDEYVRLINCYAEISKPKEIYAKLLLIALSPYLSTQEEKLQEAQSFLGKDITESGFKKRLQRARKDFQNFCNEQQKN